MIKTIKINNLINTSIDENYNFEDININELYNNFLEQIYNIEEPNISIIYVEELKIFFNVFLSMIKDDEKILEFILTHIYNKLKKNNKYCYKIDADKLIDKYLTNKIKSIDMNLYKKYSGNDYLINHLSILNLLNTYYLGDNYDEEILIPAFSVFKCQITNPKILNRVYDILK